MENTLKKGDYVIYKKSKRIKRNDIIIFKKYGKLFIKRCIGLPGDTLTIKDKKIIVNNEILKEPKTIVPLQSKKYQNKTITNFIVPFKKNKLIKKSHITNNDYYFVLGDNRPFSIDSRYFGPINKDSIVGFVILNNF